MTIDELALRKDITDAERPYVTADPARLAQTHELLLEAGYDEDLADRIVKWLRRKADGSDDGRSAPTRSYYRKILGGLNPPRKRGRSRAQRGAVDVRLLTTVLAVAGVVGAVTGLPHILALTPIILDDVNEVEAEVIELRIWRPEQVAA